MVAAGTGVTPVAPASAPFPSRLHATGGKVRDAAGAPVVMRGFNVIPVWYENPGLTWGPEHYRQIAAAGFNTVRFMLHWDTMEPRRGEVDRTHLATLDLAVARARAAGLYVVLTPITVYKGDRFTPAWAKRGDALVAIERDASGYIRTLGARYRHEDAIAAFDLVNEPPVYPPDQNRIMRMYARLTRALRAQDPARMVVVEPSYGNASMRFADMRILKRIGNTVFSMHDYYKGGDGAGYLERGDLSVSWGPRGGRHTAMDGPEYVGRHAHEFEQHLLVNLRIMRRARIPLWIGEFGTDPTAIGGERWIREKVAIYRRHGVGYAWWLYDPKGMYAPIDAGGRLKPFVGLF